MIAVRVSDHRAVDGKPRIDVQVGGWAVKQLWLFWLAPLIGAAIAGLVYKFVLGGDRDEPPIAGRAT